MLRSLLPASREHRSRCFTPGVEDCASTSCLSFMVGEWTIGGEKEKAGVLREITPSKPCQNEVSQGK